MSKAQIQSPAHSQPKSLLRKEVLLALSVALLTILYAYLGLLEMTPPAAQPVETADNEFSSARALKHLEAIAQNPHPIGSREHDRVRDYILSQLAAMGVNSEVQKTTAITSGMQPPIFAGTVENLIGRLPGADKGKAILLVSHYDSVPNSPGASDNGAGVAAMLECLRALKSSPQLKNGIVFLFTDGEEAGLLGARAFADTLPLADEIRLVLNFEARGSSGPSMLFETSADNGALIEEFASATPHPVASSLFYELYKLVPNDTDMSVFKRQGLEGLNFAYIKGLTSYHTNHDNLKSIDERSLQHHGSYALALSRHFGNFDEQIVKKPDAVFFNFIGSNLIRYPKSWVTALTLIAVVFFITLTALGFIKRRLTGAGIAAGAGALIANLILAPLLVSLAWLIIKKLQAGDASKFSDAVSQDGFYLLGFASLVVAAISSTQPFLIKKFGAQSLTIGALIWWLLLLVLTTIYLPGVSFIFLWPSLFSLLGLAFLILSKDENPTSTRNFIALAATSLPAIAILCPVIYLLPIALGMSFVWLPMILVALLVSLLVPQLHLVTRSSKLALPLLAALAFPCFILAGNWASKFGADNPMPNHLFYILDSDKQEALWASADQKPDEWTSQFISQDAASDALEQFTPYPAATYLKNQAPAAQLAAPNLEVIEDKIINGLRHLRLRLRSARQAPVFILRADSKVEIFSLSIEGKQFNLDNMPVSLGPRRPWLLHYHGLPAQGVEVVLDVNPSLPLSFRAIDQTYGLPEFESFPYRKRPEHLMPSAVYDSDSTFVAKLFTL